MACFTQTTAWHSAVRDLQTCQVNTAMHASTAQYKKCLQNFNNSKALPVHVRRNVRS
jgi:hypothetical protein